MSDLDLVIRGGSVVTATDVTLCDVGVKDGRVVMLGTNLPAAATVVNASGLLVLPGGVDGHCHIEQPSGSAAEMCDTFTTGTSSAAAGGTTTVVCFAWQMKGQSLAKATADYHLAASKSLIDYAFHLTITDATEEVIKNELPALVAEGNRSIKIFMTYEGVRVTDGEVLRVLAAARKLGALVCIHAEHHELIMFMTEQLLAAGLTLPKHHAWAKPTVVEREAVHRIIAMAEALDVPIQVFHVSAPDPAEEIARARKRGLKVWGETCPQYLTLSDEDLDRPGFEGAKYIFSPAPRSKAEQQGLWDYIRNGVIDVISSDHSATRFDDPKGKKVAGENAPFNKVPNGVPGVAARLPLVFHEGVAKGRISVSKFVDLVSTAPARMFGLFPRKGTIAIGSDADIVLWDPNKTVTLTNALMHHAGDYTPYEGMVVNGYPVATYVRGALVFDGKAIVGKPGFGQHLAREPYDIIKPNGIFPTPFNPVDRTLAS
jgi:dihydropyrimidinase